jgi:16S rRNA (guanine1516-N2)-methyltransferase
MGTSKALEKSRWAYLVLTIVLHFMEFTTFRGHAFVFQDSSRRRIAPTWTPCHALSQHVQNENDKENSSKETSNFPKRRVCVTTDYNDDTLVAFEQNVNFTKIAAELAHNLDVPLWSSLSSYSCPYTHALVVIPYQFGKIMSYAVAIQDLANNDSKKSRRRRPTKKPKSKPFFVDFCPPSNSRLGKRFEGQSGTDLLVKAVSLGKGCKTVYDLTAGFGQDSLFMAQGGASHVFMVERDPVVAALLSDGLRRLNLIASDGDSMDLLTQRALDLSGRLTLEETGDAVQVVRTILSDPAAQRPDVCYVDPMFPSRTKSAAVKKNMQILHGLLGSQSNNDAQNDGAAREERDLLDAALSLARKRVVVKRPINASHLGGISQNGVKPSYEIKGSINRWDVYVKQQETATS